MDFHPDSMQAELVAAGKARAEIESDPDATFTLRPASPSRPIGNRVVFKPCSGPATDLGFICICAANPLPQ